MPKTAESTRSPHRPLILVTGATGNIGREVANRLVEHGARVRGLVRNRPRPRPGLEWVVGDLTNPAEVRAAIAGVDTVFLIWPLLDSGPAVEVIKELAAAAPRVVYLSSTAINDNTSEQSDPIVQVHAEMESLLRDADLNPIVLRSDTLASNAPGWAPQLRTGNEVSGPDIARTPVVDERDVADAVVAALLTPDYELDDGPYLLTGPTALSRTDQIARLGDALHRPLTFRPLSADDARSRMLMDGRPQHLVDALICASENRPESTHVTDHVERLIGRPSGTFATWAADHVADFL